jgi:flagellar hook-associated protein 1 FlgK
MSSELLGIGTSSLTALRHTLDTIGHNIANANNPDYNRQITDLSARMPIRTGNGFTGTGVQVVGTRRILDDFLLESVRENTSLTNDLAASAEYAQHVDKILGDQNTGVSQSLSDFFAAVQELNSNPNSIPTRQLFLSKCGVLQSRFNDLYNKGISENSNINAQVKYTVEQINAITSSIANINVKILSFSNGSSANIPNDLFDQRDGLINQLSSLVDVSTTKQDDGSLNVFIGNGQSLVIGGMSSNLSTRNNANDASKIDVVILTNGSLQDITNNISGGKLGGTISSRDLILKTTLNSLGRLAISISNVINQQHQKGLDINGNFGGELFTNFNEPSFTLQRAVPSIVNTGDGVLKVSINAIGISDASNISLFSNGEILKPVGTLSYLSNSSALSLNGVNIRATLISDDSSSSTDNQASAIATAKAINDSFAYHGVEATVEPNTLFLGDFSIGSLSGSQFQINNTNIVSSGTSSAQLAIDINSKTNLTGVEATIDATGKLILVAQDGRNIQLTSDGTSLLASFDNFSLLSSSDLVQRSMVKLNKEEGGIIVSGTNTLAVGLSSGEYPNKGSSLSISDYQLSYNGHYYNLKRLTDNLTVGQSVTPSFNVDGLTIVLQNGTIKSGDVYEIHPTRTASKHFSLKIFQPEKVALAMPIRVQSSLLNQGDGTVSVYQINNVDGTPAGDGFKYGNAFGSAKKLNPPLKIEFISDSEYRVVDTTIGAGVQIGPIQKYNPSLQSNIIFPMGSTTDYHQPGLSSTYVFDPGYRLAISGSPKEGDVFSVDFNHDAEGDNRNGLMLSQLQNKKMMSSNNATFEESYTQLVGSIANETSKLKTNLQASENLLASVKARKDDYSGVNLDEEAANLMKFEQAYAASAHLISAARNMFDILMNTFMR